MRISAISYLNTQPFIYGIRHSGFLKDCELTLDHPAQCAEKLIAGDADVGIVPLAAIPDIPSGRIITDFCIACDGAVESVMIFSDVPMQNIRRVLLDYQSRTSVKLMQILASRHWNIAPEWKVGRQGFEKQIEGTTAGLVIGDRALGMRGRFANQYDLGLAWKEFCGLPFVFACWVANRNVSGEMLSNFSNALDYGLEHLNDVATSVGKDIPDAQSYLQNVVSFRLDDRKRKAMTLFLSML